jgi:glycerol dehydrogenase
VYRLGEVNTVSIAQVLIPQLEVLGFCVEVGLPITLAGVGVARLPRDRLVPIARRATAPGETIHNEPFEVTPDTVADALLAADALGRAWQER